MGDKPILVGAGLNPTPLMVFLAPRNGGTRTQSKLHDATVSVATVAFAGFFRPGAIIMII